MTLIALRTPADSHLRRSRHPRRRDPRNTIPYYTV